MKDVADKVAGKTLVIMRGAPGSGKTHALGLLAESIPSLQSVSFDEFRVKRGVYKYDQTDNEHVQRMAMRKLRDLLKSGEPVAIEGVFATAKSAEPYVQLAKFHGYAPLVVTMKANPEVAAARGKHNVKLSQVKRMADAIAREKLPKSWGQVEIKTERKGSE